VLLVPSTEIENATIIPNQQINLRTTGNIGTFWGCKFKLAELLQDFFSRIYIDLATHSTCIDLYWGFLGYTVYPSSSLYAAWAALAMSDKEL
jgi:hypothetical protein